LDNDTYSLENFDVFICYLESPEGKKFAEFTKKLLSTLFHLNSFVAHESRDTYSYDFDEMRKRIIRECTFFIFINTVGAFDSLEIKKEFKMAYPHFAENLKLIVLRHSSPQVKYLDDGFKSETGIDLGGINQASFSDESKLIDVIKEVFNNVKYSPYLNKTKTRLLEDYLKSCISVIDISK
jgi:hypothetical protein